MISEQDWIATPHIPSDYRGPTDRPFEPFGDPAQGVPIAERLQSIAAVHAQAIAVVDYHGTLSFAQLMRQVDRLSAAILRHPGAPGPIAVVLPAGRAYVVAMYACLATGRVATLLDASFPEARNAAVAGAVGATLVLASPGAQLAPMALPVLPVDVDSDIEGDLSSIDHAARRTIVDLDAPALVLCTSGSTGVPKAIVHSQRNMLHLARAAYDALHVRAQDRVMPLSSPTTLGGLTPLFSYPLGGASLHLIDIKSRGISGMLSDLEQSPITILRAAPSMLRGLARLPDAARAFSGLRIVQTYGESFTLADLRRLRAVLPPTCFVRTTYGATECSGLSWYADERDQHDPIRVANGTLMPDTEAVILDPSGRACARGEVGELVIRSRYNALGEFIDGRLVGGRLEPDPVDPARRIYRTGDLARCDRNGVFVVLGRSDRMIKVNGQRLELGEIEHLLRQHADVEEAEILARTRQSTTTLCAFVVAKPGRAQGLVDSLRKQLRASLPAYMVPSRIRVIARIPTLPGGKVDAQALLALMAKAD
ncbi:MAG: AMP-binding protein [Steroidobacteraceae bacterium]